MGHYFLDRGYVERVTTSWTNGIFQKCVRTSFELPSNISTMTPYSLRNVFLIKYSRGKYQRELLGKENRYKINKCNIKISTECRVLLRYFFYYYRNLNLNMYYIKWVTTSWTHCTYREKERNIAREYKRKKDRN